MSELEHLVDCILAVGFQCSRCGQCCQSMSNESNLVMVSPKEIQSVIRTSGKEWNEVAEPYPFFIDTVNGSSYTFEWCMKRINGYCSFFDDRKCRIYRQRPWICRTYPFMLNGSQLEISDCSGLGNPMSYKDAHKLAILLMQRRFEESIEDTLVKRDFLKTVLMPGKRYIIDGHGAKILDE